MDGKIILLPIGLLILVFLLVGFIQRAVPDQRGGACANLVPWSYIDQDISNGNPVSYSNKQNPIVWTDKWYDNCDKKSYVYFGSPNPLLHQMKPMAIPKDTMFYFANAKFSPECCQGGAPYSTSSGCVCAFPKQLYKCISEPVTQEPISGPNSWQ